MNEEQKRKIWKKGKIVEGYNEDMIRKDVCGAWIIYDEYGNTDSAYGWEIDYVYPKALGGDENEINLRPMQWKNIITKSDDYPSYQAAVTADGNENVDQLKYMRVSEGLQKKLTDLYH